MPDRDDTSFGLALKAARKRVGLTQKTLAERSGVQAPTISLYEVGHNTPGTRNIQRLADGLGVIFCCSGQGWFYIVAGRDRGEEQRRPGPAFGLR